MHHQYHQPPIKTFGRECLCFLQPIRIQMQYEPDGRNGLPRHSNPFTLTYSVAQAPDKDIYIGTESNGLYIYSENWKLKKHVPIDGIIATILPDNNGDIWLGLDETGICLFQQKQTEPLHGCTR